MAACCDQLAMWPIAHLYGLCAINLMLLTRKHQLQVRRDKAERLRQRLAMYIDAHAGEARFLSACVHYCLQPWSRSMPVIGLGFPAECTQCVRFVKLAGCVACLCVVGVHAEQVPAASSACTENCCAGAADRKSVV